MSSLLKQRISSPLEAGPSILDSQSLPPHLTQALEYASRRLSRKALHITLVVVRKDYQLPSSTLPCATPTSSVSVPASPEFSWSSGPLSPSRLVAPVAGLRQLVRRGTGGSTASTSTTASGISSRSAATSPTFQPHSTEPQSHTLLGSLRRLPSTPATPCTPATPYSAVTSTSTSSASSTSSTASAGGPNPFGIRLLHTTSLSPKEEYILRRTISKAERKFHTGTGFLPPTSSASSCGLDTDLIRRSIRQNEVLFSSEGLTLLGLDRLYTFKSALAAYARTTLRGHEDARERESRIEDAVDELRRLVLSRGGRRLERRELYGSYVWIGVSAGALGDVERMYRRAYGGAMGVGAFGEAAAAARNTAAKAAVAAVTATITTASKANTEKEEDNQEWPLKMSVVATKMSSPVPKIGQPPSPKPKAHTPILKLQTKFEAPEPAVADVKKPSAIRPIPVKPVATASSSSSTQDELIINIDVFSDEEEEENDGDVTAKPNTAGAAKHGMSFWNGIDEMLARRDHHGLPSEMAVSPVIQRLRTSQQQRMGPATPNGYDDISPVTRGEWGFLFKGDGWNGGRTAAVETC
ncbi:hypothetical protein TruAng_001202 [Truncatella angustata]|nr:hypothetical protein TruAng_001202 [Truncatella angustata]